MKLGPVTKPDKGYKATSKIFDDDVILENCSAIVIFQFMANLEPSVSWIPNAESVKITFSLKVTSYLTKSKNRNK